jgi:ATP-binding cassette, subfamily B, bacterial HlyB/CyaB
MLGLRLVQPLIHASSLMQDYQRSVLSLKLLAQLMQTAPEPSRASSPRPSAATSSSTV